MDKYGYKYKENLVVYFSFFRRFVYLLNIRKIFYNFEFYYE